MLLPLQLLCLDKNYHDKLIQVAQKYVGTVEVSYNRSKQINKWNIDAGANLGSSWCMSSLYGMHKETSESLKVKNPLKRTASCSEQLKYANLIGSGLKVIKTSLIGKVKIQRADIFIQKHGSFSERDIGKNWLGHCGICDEQKKKNEVDTYEGNTNSRKTRESKGKDGYWKLTRNINSFLALIRT